MMRFADSVILRNKLMQSTCECDALVHICYFDKLEEHIRRGGEWGYTGQFV